MISVVTDRRTYKDRRDVWAVEKKSDYVVHERPKAKIKQVSVADENAARKAKRLAAARAKREGRTEEELVRSYRS